MTRVFSASPPVRRMVLVGFGLLTGMAAAAYLAASARTASPDASRADFDLVDSSGRAYSLEGFPPESVLVIYFGYTTCLRACPIALDSIVAAMDGFGAQRAAVWPVFIDMDPERAAQVSLPLYMQTFGPDFLGLTGSPDAVARAARAFEVDVERLQFSADPGDYAMTHVSPIFLMRPGDGHPVALPPTSSPEIIAAALRAALR